MCTDFGYSTVLRQLSHRPQRPHSTALAAPRAIGRATSEVGTGPVHLASRCATIAPTTRHPGQQLAVTTTLGKAAVGVAPANTTIHPGRPTRPGWPAYLYCRRQGCFRTKYLATPAAAALCAQILGTAQCYGSCRTGPNAHTALPWLLPEPLGEPPARYAPGQST